VAHLRAEKEQRERDFDEGSRLVSKVCKAVHHIKRFPTTYDDRYSRFNALLVQVNWVLELLQFHPDADDLRLLLAVKGEVHRQLGQHKLAVATYQQADDAFTKAERIGSLTVTGNNNWMLMLNDLGTLYLSVHQLEFAKRCFLRM